MKIINYGLTPKGKDIIKDYTRSENPYLILFINNDVQVPLYRYINEDKVLFEFLEGVVINHDDLEIYIALTDSIVFHTNPIEKWNVAILNDDSNIFLN